MFSAVRRVLDENFTPEEQRELFQAAWSVTARVAALYVSYKLQQWLIRKIVNPEYAKRKELALSILQNAGFDPVNAHRIQKHLNPYEVTVLQDLVTNTSTLNELADIKGLRRPKEIIYQNLKTVQKMKQMKVMGNLIRVPPGILLYGPPGCGKTMMARAVAKEIGFRFLCIKPSVINNKYIGETEKTIQGIFSLGAKLEPIVLFIDEIEVLLGSRGDFNSDFRDTKIAEFLTAWDGFEKNEATIVVIGATNRKELLDAAILRRLPLKIEIPLPDRDSRQEIFESKLTREGIRLEADLDHYVDVTEKWDASKITNFLQSVLTHAAQAAMESNESQVNTQDNTRSNDSEDNGSLFLSIFNWFTESHEEPRQDPSVTEITVTNHHFQSAFELFASENNSLCTMYC